MRREILVKDPLFGIPFEEYSFSVECSLSKTGYHRINIVLDHLGTLLHISCGCNNEKVTKMVEALKGKSCISELNKIKTRIRESDHGGYYSQNLKDLLIQKILSRKHQLEKLANRSKVWNDSDLYTVNYNSHNKQSQIVVDLNTVDIRFDTFVQLLARHLQRKAGSIPIKITTNDNKEIILNILGNTETALRPIATYNRSLRKWSFDESNIITRADGSYDYGGQTCLVCGVRKKSKRHCRTADHKAQVLFLARKLIKSWPIRNRAYTDLPYSIGLWYPTKDEVRRLSDKADREAKNVTDRSIRI